MDKLIGAVKSIIVFIVVFLLLWQLWGFLLLIIGGKLYYDTFGIWIIANAVVTYAITVKIRKPKAEKTEE